MTNACISEMIPRGATIEFATDFYDFDGELTNPAGAVINLVYPNTSGVSQTTQLTMTPPAGAETKWTAVFDTRDVGPGIVFWSVHSENAGSPPFAVEDGRFTIDANVANLTTF